MALLAALRSIGKRDGGLVEAYPIVLAKGDPANDERLARVVEWYSSFNRLIKTHGRFSGEMEQHLRNHSHVHPDPHPTRVVMRKTVTPAR